MDGFDSDSSSGELSDGTATNINLGYASKVPTGDTISHLGGFPVRIPPLTYFGIDC
jgi:pre-rRNA-processing protein TSR4